MLTAWPDVGSPPTVVTNPCDSLVTSAFEVCGQHVLTASKGQKCPTSPGSAHVHELLISLLSELKNGIFSLQISNWRTLKQIHFCCTSKFSNLWLLSGATTSRSFRMCLFLNLQRSGLRRLCSPAKQVSAGFVTVCQWQSCPQDSDARVLTCKTWSSDTKLSVKFSRTQAASPKGWMQISSPGELKLQEIWGFHPGSRKSTTSSLQTYRMAEGPKSCKNKAPLIPNLWFLSAKQFPT